MADAIGKITFDSSLDLDAQRALVDLPRRTFPPVADAERQLQRASQKLAHLRHMGAPPQEVRGAEVDWFGAEETVRLAKLAAEGKLVGAYQSCLPAEVQALKVGPWTFVGWPGEVFVEYALAVKAEACDTYVISLANGELQGYIVTEAAVSEGGYEASNAIFAPAAGQTLVEATVRLVARQ